ncbi:hypothetical protein [Microbacterium sp. SORGH_AS_0421]|uniref:hypothetical protein n=1 Tax=Microbacterium sp. SORGH_AS_0421 TaxID=3041768 RepID=UPI00279480D4|nr:hypothetical protein [Microbacterium sp. SORGH_AS_0421]MDQ1176236.1 hypothetical protein [Microbacterium sp. SORGH_AS_0421]
MAVCPTVEKVQLHEVDVDQVPDPQSRQPRRHRMARGKPDRLLDDTRRSDAPVPLIDVVDPDAAHERAARGVEGGEKEGFKRDVAAAKN